MPNPGCHWHSDIPTKNPAAIADFPPGPGRPCRSWKNVQKCVGHRCWASPQPSLSWDASWCGPWPKTAVPTASRLFLHRSRSRAICPVGIRCNWSRLPDHQSQLVRRFPDLVIQPSRRYSFLHSTPGAPLPLRRLPSHRGRETGSNPRRASKLRKERTKQSVPGSASVAPCRSDVCLLQTLDCRLQMRTAGRQNRCTSGITHA